MPEIFLSLALSVARLSLLLPSCRLAEEDATSPPLTEDTLCRLVKDSRGSLNASNKKIEGYAIYHFITG